VRLAAVVPIAAFALGAAPAVHAIESEADAKRACGVKVFSTREEKEKIDACMADYHRRARQEVEAQREQQRRAMAEQFAAQKAEDERQQAAAAAAARRRDAEREAAQAQADAEEAADSKKIEAAERATRRRCGADYRRCEVGMSFKRIRECSDFGFEHVGQAKTKDGVADVWESGGRYIYVVSGTVVAWKRTR
jgi:hypothetical protein